MDNGTLMPGAKHIPPRSSLFEPATATLLSRQTPPNETEEDSDAKELDTIIQTYQNSLKTNIVQTNQKLTELAKKECQACVNNATK